MGRVNSVEPGTVPTELLSWGSRGLLGRGASPPGALLGLGAAEPASSKHLAQETATTSTERGHIHRHIRAVVRGQEH